MARWPPDAQQRLTRAALDLFVQRGYEDTTVVDIVERAGLGKTTFFRYFKDKREVLFGGEERDDLIADAIASAPASPSPIEAMAVALDAAGRERFTPERRKALALRQTVIDANSQLREREALKYVGLVASATAALEERGFTALQSAVAAELGVLTLKLAFARWVTDAEADFASLARQILDEVQSTAPR